jgi:hypothetical protein
LICIHLAKYSPEALRRLDKGESARSVAIWLNSLPEIGTRIVRHGNVLRHAKHTRKGLVVR